MTGISWTDETWNRFVSYVEKTAYCWRWTAGTFSNGYGQFRVGAKKVRAHRAAYERLVGVIPPGKVVCHRCDNPLCVRPDHLFLGTALDNARDRDSKGRGAPPPVTELHGSANPAAKLTRDDVRAILAASGHESQRSIAKRFGISQSQVGNILRGDAWRRS